MTGWNLPPGCNVSGLPGNRKEDQEAEAFWDTFYEMEENARAAHPEKGDAYVEAMVEWVWDMIGKAYGDGYQQAVADTAEAKEIAETERLAKEYWESEGKSQR